MTLAGFDHGETSGVVEVSSLHRTEVCAGRPVAHGAAEMGASRATAHTWVRRWRAEGGAGLADRSSRPRTTPHRTTATVEARICRLRQDRKLGPARIGPVLGLPASTVHRVLVRHGLNRLAFLDRPTGQVIRRRGPLGFSESVDAEGFGTASRFRAPDSSCTGAAAGVGLAANAAALGQVSNPRHESCLSRRRLTSSDGRGPAVRVSPL
ncbi:leucine-zipper of insertion element IS481 [Streptomyces mirabilis]|uniref:Leucine-zipper of insertion element IS481 n=1 Tax=Streptomyces mirabilis TaxID=68239 RepID=A0A1I2L8W6_9ACTN|nr:leucine-zipper of insertion element IS481 [Streptomyces mirabilis]